MKKYKTYINESWDDNWNWKAYIFDSIQDNDFEKFKQLLNDNIYSDKSKSKSINSIINMELFGSTPLLKILNNNRIEFFNYIVDDMDLNYSSFDIKSPLVYCLWNSEFDMFQLLIDNGADINSISKSNNQTPLIFGADLNNLKKIQICIENDADWSICSGDQCFLDILESNGFKKYIIKKYPEHYKKYLKQKATKKFKI